MFVITIGWVWDDRGPGFSSWIPRQFLPIVSINQKAARTRFTAKDGTWTETTSAP